MSDRSEASVPGSKEGKIIGESGFIVPSLMTKLLESVISDAIDVKAKVMAQKKYNMMTNGILI